ncbi:terpene synthase family protein [Streptomyces syringium]|uniref:terpene synthase family protein n=1 Tax=Streptomyces syringium TaxID=76729 RepID=UPI0033D351BA
MTPLPPQGLQLGNDDQTPYPSFRLPPFPRFQPALRRPGLDKLEASWRAWLDDALRPAHTEDRRAFEEFLNHRTTLWNLLTYPTCDTERTGTICHWIDVLFSIDDLFVQAPHACLERLGLHQLDTALDDDQPAPQALYPKVLAALAKRLRADMSSNLWNRFAQDTRGFFAACRAERGWVEAGTAMDLTTYEESRIKSIGACCFPLLEHGLSIDLTGELAATPELGRLNHLVARHWIAVNDIFSYRKELYSGDTINEITLALASNGGDLQAAVDHIAETIRGIEMEFCGISARLLGGTFGQDPTVSRYVEALRWMIAGNLEWSYITPRYNGHGHTWTGQTADIVILTPHRTLYQTTGPRLQAR